MVDGHTDYGDRPLWWPCYVRPDCAVCPLLTMSHVWSELVSCLHMQCWNWGKHAQKPSALVTINVGLCALLTGPVWNTHGLRGYVMHNGGGC